MSESAWRPDEALIERALRGEASESERMRVTEWRQASPENEQAYREIARLVEATRSLTRAAQVPARPAAGSIVSRAASAGQAKSRGWLLRWVPWTVAAAALLAAIALGLRPAVEPAGWAPAEVVTGASELATIKLADGSVVRLAPSSRLLVPGGERGREVTLEGRAFFAITPIPDAPFFVHTRGATVRVLGTRFELATDADEVQLRVLEGRVALEAPENRIEVGSGEQSAVRYGAATRPTPLQDAETATAWLGRFLVFHATPLRDAARAIEELYDARIVIADSTLAKETITATFTDRPLDDVAGIICSVLNAPCTTRERVVTIGR